MAESYYDIGMVGLGTMGRNLLLNMADHGFSVAGYDIDPAKLDLLRTEAGDRDARGVAGLEEMVSRLRVPRVVMLLVPAGPPTDAAVAQVSSLLQPGDLIIDGGNSHFTDTDNRARALGEKGILFMGLGISGGEYGARHGPSLMPGGPPEAYERVHPLLEAIAARVGEEPCVAYLGPNPAGHYVKMVHNGIEYALMQLIAESYDLMKRGLGLSNAEIQTIYSEWDKSELNSYLMEITTRVLGRKDERTGGSLVDMILDRAMQKGTGMWASQDAFELGAPIPTIDAAVTMRNLSVMRSERVSASEVLAGPDRTGTGDRATVVGQLREALYAAMLIAYSQGIALLRSASVARSYNLKLEDVARIWRGGCIIRAALLEKIRAAFHRNALLPNPLMDAELGQEVVAKQGQLREIVCLAARQGIPASALSASLGYYDAYRSAWLPANLIQAQRDYFGAHTYERVDAKGVFHTEWGEV